MGGAGSAPASPRSLGDQVDVVGDAGGSAPADADEDAVVEPGELRVGRLNRDRGAERVLGGIHVLAGREAGEHLRRAMAYTLGADVEQRAAVGLQGVADVGDR